MPATGIDVYSRMLVQYGYEIERVHSGSLAKGARGWVYHYARLDQQNVPEILGRRKGETYRLTLLKWSDAAGVEAAKDQRHDHPACPVEGDLFFDATLDKDPAPAGARAWAGLKVEAGGQTHRGCRQDVDLRLHLAALPQIAAHKARGAKIVAQVRTARPVPMGPLVSNANAVVRVPWTEVSPKLYVGERPFGGKTPMQFPRTLASLDRHGFDVSHKQAGIEWAASAYPLFHANAAGRGNIRSGLAPPGSGHPTFNSHADDIDYQIEADYSGLMAPGLRQQAGRIVRSVPDRLEERGVVRRRLRHDRALWADGGGYPMAPQRRRWFARVGRRAGLPGRLPAQRHGVGPGESRA